MRLLLPIVICALSVYNASAITGMRGGIREPFVESSVRLPPDEWFHQKLDHFDPTSSATWKQRYNTNDKFFRHRKNAPVFLMIGGEGNASPKWLVSGMWIKYAEKYGALCFQLEHRFYGKSHPTKDLSTENLKYLTSEQALADLAYFIEGMNKKYKLTSANKWVSFGGSYPGMLSAWLRQKYPHLNHAAVASSAPLGVKTDFFEYDDTVRASLRTHSDSCANTVHEANLQIQKLLKSKHGQKIVHKEFKLCKNFNPHNKKDVATFFQSIADVLGAFVQYNNDDLSERPNANFIDTICNILTKEGNGNAVQRYAALNSFLLKKLKVHCRDSTYSKVIHDLKHQLKFDPSQNGRQWFYQICTQLGIFPTSSKKSSLYGATFDVTYFEDMCSDVFGPKFNGKSVRDAVYKTLVLYGGLNIKATRIVYVNGSIDPCQALGIKHSKNPSAPAIFIHGTAHCADMYTPSKRDSRELKDARKKISKLIGKWLKE